LQAIPLEAFRGWQITFRSTNAGMCHQLYVNGSLADWTDTIGQRRFLLDADTSVREIAIVAVDSAHRTTDLSQNLPPKLLQSGWVYRASVVRAIGMSRRCRVALFEDHATGQLSSSPTLVREVWPECAARWAWGEDAFGRGGFGYDGTFAPGLGKGAMGAGAFGMDTDLIMIEAPLQEEGSHQTILKTLTDDGQVAEAEIQFVGASPPPAPPVTITATDWDNQNNTLTLEIERG